jgi:hypothetical protein
MRLDQTVSIAESREPVTRRISAAARYWALRIVNFPASKNSRSILALNVQALSVFRIGFSIYLGAHFFISVHPWYDDFYSDVGVLPLAALAGHDNSGMAVVGPLLGFLDPLRTSLAFAVLYATSLFCFAVGFHTRLANAAAYVLNAYLFWRNPYVLSGADDLAHLMLLWCLFLPMNRCWSVDSALDSQPPDRSFPAIPFIAVRFQIVSLYFVSALFKLEGAPWRSGEALTWVFSDTAYSETPAAVFLLQQTPDLLYIANYAVMAFQLAFPFLVYWPWRNDWTRGFALLGAACMHVSFIICLNIGSFPFLSLITLILMIPDAWIDRLLRPRRTRLEDVTLYYDASCELCRKTMLILREFLLSRSVQVLPANADAEGLQPLDGHRVWVVRARDGTLMANGSALAYILKQNFLSAPLGLLLSLAPVRRSLGKLYQLIGRNRRVLVSLATWLSANRKVGPLPGPAIAICAFLAVLALASNISSLLSPSDDNESDFVNRTAAAFQVQQRWRLFAPIPSHAIWHYDIVVSKADGSTVEFMRLLPVPLFDTSGDRVRAASHLWFKYFTRLEYFGDDDLDALGSYLCRKSQIAIGRLPVVTAIDVKTSTRSALEHPDSPADPLLEEHFDCEGDKI